MSEKRYIFRSITAKLQDLFQHFPVVVLSGARQVGKSTLLEHTFPKIPRVIFDPIVDVENARSDPDLFLDNRLPPVILDEVQYAPELVPAIKRRLERDRRPGQYLLTGSQQWGVMKLLSESLAGRAVFLDLEGFSLAEVSQSLPGDFWLEAWMREPGAFISGRRDRLPLTRTVYEQIWRGFLPEAHFLPARLVSTFHEAYQKTYIERDVGYLAELSDVRLFSRFFRLCSALTAQEINRSQFGRELGVTPQTAGRWLNILHSTFQWFEIPPYSGNAIKRLSGKSKGYLGDTGMICNTQAIGTPDALGGHPLWGSLFETAVVCEIRKRSRMMDSPPNLYHWRSHGGGEVDLLLEWNGKFYPLEIKGKSHPTRADIRGIEAFRKTYPRLQIPAAGVIAPCESFSKISEDVHLFPWDLA